MKLRAFPGTPRSGRGLALVTVLWVLVLLALMAASFTATTRSEINLTRNEIENAQAEALAEAALARALLGLLASRRGIDFGGPVEQPLAERPGLRGALEARPELQAAQGAAQEAAGEAAPVAPGAGEAWRADGTVYGWDFGGGALRAAVHGETGKIDLNAADEALLRALFRAATWSGPDGAPQSLGEAAVLALVDALRDFADADDLTRLNGAEDPDYAAAGLAWGAKDAPFEAVEELQQVLGVTAPLYRAVAPALTVYSGAKGVDPDLAPPLVLLALSAGRGAGGALRRGRARVYTIHAEARLPGGAVFARQAVVRLGGGAQAYRIEAWRQGRRELFP